ncbi:hypothetical protein Hbl1158_13230 [Halobaculum sp. CBA1158]|uniref:hypothetical protein n=1 Tax=Halobaculum sp. CBA1158 TaxID=2904243 RepID=UPI001F199D3F|nr:hypothetical protein [Halobaculum sp. CBA1158]UIO99475.1 hypothetical protein Hbl1158_13230 [Halobaculum sp. CBA1158]
MERKVLLGGALMLVGTLLLVPGVSPTAGTPARLALLPAAALLTYGTYLIGTSEDGRAV